MKLKEFKKKMQKGVFSIEEARRIAWESSPKTLTLQLHQWVQGGDLIRLKKGVYAFPEQVVDKIEVARALYGPAYVSLEYALHFYGLIPDVVFALTLVTPKISRNFVTPLGQFIYHKIKTDLFWGYDPQTLLGEREKVVIDYCYLYSGRLLPRPDFWEQSRWQHLEQIDFDRLKAYAKRVGVAKVSKLVQSLEEYQKGTFQISPPL